MPGAGGQLEIGADQSQYRQRALEAKIAAERAEIGIDGGLQQAAVDLGIQRHLADRFGGKRQILLQRLGEGGQILGRGGDPQILGRRHGVEATEVAGDIGRQPGQVAQLQLAECQVAPLQCGVQRQVLERLAIQAGRAHRQFHVGIEGAQRFQARQGIRRRRGGGRLARRIATGGLL